MFTETFFTFFQVLLFFMFTEQSLFPTDKQCQFYYVLNMFGGLFLYCILVH